MKRSITLLVVLSIFVAYGLNNADAHCGKDHAKSDTCDTCKAHAKPKTVAKKDDCKDHSHAKPAAKKDDKKCCSTCKGTPLFNGKCLSGWMSAAGGEPGKGWKVIDGAIVLDGKGGGNLFTKKAYGDFVLSLEYKTEGNSGLLLRTSDPKSYVQTCMEMQVLPPTDKPNKNSCGSLYDCVAPKKDPSKKGEWNKVVVTMNGPKVKFEINGVTTVDVNLDDWKEGNKNPDGSKNKFKKPLKDFARKGHIGVQDHGAKVMYRNITIKEL